MWAFTAQFTLALSGEVTFLKKKSRRVEDVRGNDAISDSHFKFLHHKCNPGVRGTKTLESGSIYRIRNQCLKIASIRASRRRGKNWDFLLWSVFREITSRKVQATATGFSSIHFPNFPHPLFAVPQSYQPSMVDWKKDFVPEGVPISRPSDVLYICVRGKQSRKLSFLPPPGNHRLLKFVVNLH